MNTPTLEFRLSFHVPGSDVASLAAGTAVLAALQKTLSEHGCTMTLHFICPTSDPTPDTPETRAADTAVEQQEAVEAAPSLTHQSAT